MIKTVNTNQDFQFTIENNMNLEFTNVPHSTILYTKLNIIIDIVKVQKIT